MALFENFPYTNFHELNLDWIIKTFKELNDKFDAAITAKIKFADPLQWDITSPYEELTIVVNDNLAYLSMQPVPPGKLITDTDYWQQIFDMTTFYQMIADLEQQVEDDIQAVNDDIDELDQNTVKTDNNRHLLFLGDSYTTGNNGALYTAFVNNCGIPAANCHNVAVSGSSFQDASNSFQNQLENYTGDKNIITDIVIAGGINDAIPAYDVPVYPDASALTSAMSSFMAYAQLHYPNAKCHLGYIGGCMVSSQYYSQYHPAKSQEMALYMYTMAASNYGFDILPVYNVIHATSLYYGTDGLHPSLDGCNAIGSALAAAFRHEYAPTIRPIIEAVINFNWNIARVGAMTYYPAVMNDIVTVNVPTFYFNCRSGYAVGNTPVNVADLSVGNIRVKKPITVQVTALLNGFTNTAAFHPVPGLLTFGDGAISLSLSEVANGSYVNFSAASDSATITILGFEFTTRTININ